MVINESIDIEGQIKLLIDNGWYQDAKNCTLLTYEHKLLSREAHDRFMRTLVGKPATAHPGHEVYGCTYGFDSNTVLSSLQFRKLTSIGEMKKAFKQAVNKIEIEPSTQCNRRCTYCPNSTPELAHRLKHNEFFDMKMFEKMLFDLKEIDYCDKIALVGMNEFFMHEQNFEYAKMIKAMLPKSYLQVYSNGDYLDDALLERAESAGVDLLMVSFHQQAGKPYSDEDVLDRADKFMRRTNLPLTITDHQKGVRLHMQAHMKTMHIAAGLVNWQDDGHNWGGSLECGRELAAPDVPCESPVNVLCLAQNGDFTLCCNVPRERTQENVANGAVLGNLKDFPSMFHAYASDAMLYWRQHSFSTQRMPKLCQDCSGRNTQGNKVNAKIAKFIDQQPLSYAPAHNVQTVNRAAVA
jgi:hypothetical protein